MQLFKIYTVKPVLIITTGQMKWLDSARLSNLLQVTWQAKFRPFGPTLNHTDTFDKNWEKTKSLCWPVLPVK